MNTTTLVSFPVTLYTAELALHVVGTGMNRYYAQRNGALLYTYPGTRLPWMPEDWHLLPESLHSKVPEVSRCLGCGIDVDECVCTNNATLSFVEEETDD